MYFHLQNPLKPNKYKSNDRCVGEGWGWGGGRNLTRRAVAVGRIGRPVS